jgi:hypothetical protein
VLVVLVKLSLFFPVALRDWVISYPLVVDLVDLIPCLVVLAGPVVAVVLTVIGLVGWV